MLTNIVLMSQIALACVEEGLRFAQQRATVLAADTANARTPGFQPKDLTMTLAGSATEVRFAAALQDVDVRGTVGLIEYATAAQGKNAVRYHALVDQARAMLHELRMIAEEARR